LGSKTLVQRDLVQKDPIMIKNCLFAVALVSLTLAGGCATGGNGFVPTVTVAPPDGFNFIGSMYPTQSVALTATVTGASNTAVTWSLSPAATCTGTPNPCGTFTSVTSTTVTYVAPTTPISGIAVTATLVSNSLAYGNLPVSVIPVSVVVTPTSTPTAAVIVGENLVQQFTAVAFPEDAPQAFTWSVTSCSVQPCGTIASDSANVATYTAPPNAATVAVSAAWNPPTPPNPAPAGQTNVTVVASRLSAATYSFQFSGHDNSNNPVAAAGSFVLASTGTITAGVEDVLSATGPTQYPIGSVSYAPISSKNSLGTLTVALTGGRTNQYTAVLTSSGIIRMIESDAFGTGSGVMQVSAKSTVFNSGAQTFAFGFTGVDSSANRIGYVGLLPLSGSGSINAGLLDTNDSATGSDTSVCSSPPCTITSGTYSQPNAADLPTWWKMQLTLASGAQLGFDFFVSAGTAQTKTSPGPLTLYAISTDPVTTNPAVSGSMVYQVPMTSGYNNAAFNGTSVSALTGTNANVSLTYGATDGTDGGTGGAGGFTGNFDWNNNGTIVSVSPTQPFSYTYVASSGNTGRYVFQMLGNPNATTVVPPLSFVLYASGANRGFLLDQSSPAVMTGAMYPQPVNQNNSYAPSELPGAYAAAAVSNGEPGIAPAVENLLLTWTGVGTDFTGVQNPGNQTLTGALYTTSNGTVTNTFQFTGAGIITLTAPSAATDAIYAIDVTIVPNPANPAVPNPVITDFFTMGTTSGSPSALIFAQQ
jgi:hypothetical protein